MACIEYCVTLLQSLLECDQTSPQVSCENLKYTFCVYPPVASANMQTPAFELRHNVLSAESYAETYEDLLYGIWLLILRQGQAQQVISAALDAFRLLYVTRPMTRRFVTYVTLHLERILHDASNDQQLPGLNFITTSEAWKSLMQQCNRDKDELMAAKHLIDEFYLCLHAGQTNNVAHKYIELLPFHTLVNDSLKKLYLKMSEKTSHGQVELKEMKAIIHQPAPSSLSDVPLGQRLDFLPATKGRADELAHTQMATSAARHQVSHLLTEEMLQGYTELRGAEEQERAGALFSRMLLHCGEPFTSLLLDKLFGRLHDAFSLYWGLAVQILYTLYGAQCPILDVRNVPVEAQFIVDEGIEVVENDAEHSLPGESIKQEPFSDGHGEPTQSGASYSQYHTGGLSFLYETQQPTLHDLFLVRFMWCSLEISTSSATPKLPETYGSSLLSSVLLCSPAITPFAWKFFHQHICEALSPSSAASESAGVAKDRNIALLRLRTASGLRALYELMRHRGPYRLKSLQLLLHYAMSEIEPLRIGAVKLLARHVWNDPVLGSLSPLNNGDENCPTRCSLASMIVNHAKQSFRNLLSPMPEMSMGMENSEEKAVKDKLRGKIACFCALLFELCKGDTSYLAEIFEVGGELHTRGAALVEETFLDLPELAQLFAVYASETGWYTFLLLAPESSSRLIQRVVDIMATALRNTFRKEKQSTETPPRTVVPASLPISLLVAICTQLHTRHHHDIHYLLPLLPFLPPLPPSLHLPPPAPPPRHLPTPLPSPGRSVTFSSRSPRPPARCSPPKSFSCCFTLLRLSPQRVPSPLPFTPYSSSRGPPL